MANYIEEPIRVRLRQEQYDALWSLAHHRGRPIVDLIRESIATLLANAPEDIPALVAHYAIEPEPWPEDRPIEDHPDWILVNDVIAEAERATPSGTSSVGLSNASVEHDKVLAEIFEEEINSKKTRHAS